MLHTQMKQLLLYFIMLNLLSICGCGNSSQPTNFIMGSLIVGKWKMLGYAGGYVNKLDTLIQKWQG